MLFFSILYSGDKIVQDSFENKFGYKLGFTTSALANIFPGIQIGQELSYKRFLFNIEAAYIFESNSAKEDKARGFRIRPAIGYKIFKTTQSYGSFDIFYNFRYVDIYRELEISRAFGAYTEVIRGNIFNTMKGFGIQYRHAFDLGNMFVKTGFGLGHMDLHNNYTNDELQIFRPRLFFNSYLEPGHQPFGSAFITVSFLWKLN